MSEKNKLLGILGGLGPMATAYFYEMLIEHTPAGCDQDHIDVVISGRASTPDRTEYILTGKGEDPFEYMLNDAKKLVDYGADIIAIPCNTAHFFYDKLVESINIPILNIISETVRTVKSLGCKTVGVMATDGTIKTESYKRECDKAGIECVVPDETDQKEIMSFIYDSVKTGKKADMNRFMNITGKFRDKDCERVILGCTELSVIKKDENLDEYYIDSLEVLAKTTIEAFSKKPVGFRGI